MQNAQFISLVLLLSTVTSQVTAKTYKVTHRHSQKVVQGLCQRVQAGDIIEFAPGSYQHLQGLAIHNNGSADNEIVLRAAKAGTVQFNGHFDLSVHGSYIRLEGFHWPFNPDRNVTIRVFGNHVTLTQLWFVGQGNILVEPEADTSPDDFKNRARYLEISHCAFVDKPTGGQWIAFFSSASSPQWQVISEAAGKDVAALAQVLPRNAKIHHNYFSGPVVPGNSGGAFRFGFGTGTVPVGTRCLVENNLFEQFNQEKEIIPAKQGGNVYRYNTFRQCKGELSLRSGGRQIVISNYFLDMPGQSLAMWGPNNFIANNVFRSGTHYFVRLNPAVDNADDPFYQLPTKEQGGVFHRYHCEGMVFLNNTVIDKHDYNNPKVKKNMPTQGYGSVLAFDHYKCTTADRLGNYGNYKMLVQNNYILRQKPTDVKLLGDYNEMGYYSSSSGWPGHTQGPQPEHLVSNNVTIKKNVMDFGFLLQSIPHPKQLADGSIINDDNSMPKQVNGYPVYTGKTTAAMPVWADIVPDIPDLGFDTVAFVKNELTLNGKLTIGSNLPTKQPPLTYEKVGPDWLKDHPSLYGQTGNYRKDYYDQFKQWAQKTNYRHKSILQDKAIQLK